MNYKLKIEKIAAEKPNIQEDNEKTGHKNMKNTSILNNFTTP